MRTEQSLQKIYRRKVFRVNGNVSSNVMSIQYSTVYCEVEHWTNMIVYFFKNRAIPVLDPSRKKNSGKLMSFKLQHNVKNRCKLRNISTAKDSNAAESIKAWHFPAGYPDTPSLGAECW